MYSLSYISDAVGATSVDAEAELVQGILRTARKRNQHLNITGLLAYAHGVFLQVLEGEEAKVDALFTRILNDSRNTNVQLLHRGEISERIYADWAMGSAFRLGTVHDYSSVHDYSARIAFLRSRFGKDRLASSADYFRYLLTPSQISNLGALGRVRRVGIFASSALWFTPVFNAIADETSIRPTTVLVSDPDTIASSFPLDYVDFESAEGGAVRITGFGKDMLRSPLIGPFLKGIDLLVVLMRRSDPESSTEKLRTVLNLREIKLAMPDVMCISPGMDKKLQAELVNIGLDSKIQVMTASASLLMGNEVLSVIKNWLVQNKLTDRRDNNADDIDDSITIPANPLPPTTAAANTTVKKLDLVASVSVPSSPIPTRAQHNSAQANGK
ncbi:MAG: BLUF domain-containing protein [Gammaproteobacteria bacterium]|nr:BLUF domain-containing protein [Gammaproteobacteria bacterium]